MMTRAEGEGDITWKTATARAVVAVALGGAIFTFLEKIYDSGRLANMPAELEPAVLVERGLGLMETILAALGAGTNDVVAAFLGSVCGAFFLTDAKPRSIIGTVFVGTCVGIYFGPNSMMLIGKQPNNVITFIIGSIGMAALASAGNFIKGRFFLNGGSNVRSTGLDAGRNRGNGGV